MKILTIIIFTFAYTQISAQSLASLQNTQMVSLVFVGSKSGLSESSFGHVALRFSPQNSLGLFDTVVQFVADVKTNDGMLEKYVKGSGLVGNYSYNVITEIQSFYNYQEIKTRHENRDVHIYPLELTNNQIQKLINYVANFSNEDRSDQKYRFFKQNCSYFAADAIELATQRDLKVKSHPWRLANELQQQGIIVRAESFIASLSNEREQALIKVMNSKLGQTLEKKNWATTFKENINSEDPMIKLNSYLKLLAISQQQDMDDETKQSALTSYRYLMSLEKSVHKKLLKRIFESTTADSLISLENASLIKSAFPKNLESVEHEVILWKNYPSIKLTWKNHDSNRDTLYIPMRGLSYYPSQHIIKRDDTEVANTIFTRRHKWIALKNLSYSLDFNKETSEIGVIMHVDHNAKKTKRDYDHFQSLDTLALSNLFDFNQGFGSCYAMVKLQKAFNDRALFIPNSTQNELDKVDKMAILEDLYNGQFVVINGHDNIKDFTQSINKEDLVNFVKQKQELLHTNRATTFISNMFKKEVIDEDSVEHLYSLVQSGHSPEMMVAMRKKGERKYEQAAHVVLVLNMIKNDKNGYDLKIYDPNYGLSDKMTINSDYMIEYSMFRDDYEYTGIINEIDKDRVEFDLGMRSMHFDERRLRSYVREVEAKSIHPYQLF